MINKSVYTFVAIRYRVAQSLITWRLGVVATLNQSIYLKTI